MENLRPGYRSFVEPRHPIVDLLVGDLTADSPADLEGVLAALRRRFKYRADRGRTGLEEVRQGLEASGGLLVPINCIDLSCVLVSVLRRLGVAAEDVFVASGDTLTPEGDRWVDFHAVVLVRREPGWLWVDPLDLLIVARTVEEVEASLKPHVIFNDRFLHAVSAEKIRLLGQRDASSGIQFLLYGNTTAEMQAALKAPGCHQCLAGFFRDESPRLEPDSELFEKLRLAGLIARRGGRVVPGRQVVLVPKAPERAFRARVQPALDRYLAIVAKTVPALRKAYSASAPAERFDWPQVCHAVVAGMFLDLAIGARLGLAREVSEAHGAAVVWAFEDISAANGFGVQWSGDAARPYGFSQLWHCRVRRGRLPLTQTAVDGLADFCAGTPVVTTTPDWLKLRYLKLVSGPRGHAQFDVPAFLPDDCTRLLGPLMEGAEAIVREAIRPAFGLAAGDPWWQRLETDGTSRHAGVRLLLEYITDRVVDAGLMDPFPEGDDVAVSWGRWFWHQSEAAPRLMTVPPDRAEREVAPT